MLYQSLHKCFVLGTVPIKISKSRQKNSTALIRRFGLLGLVYQIQSFSSTLKLEFQMAQFTMRFNVNLAMYTLIYHWVLIM